jgi:hypothetical protein
MGDRKGYYRGVQLLSGRERSSAPTDLISRKFALHRSKFGRDRFWNICRTMGTCRLFQAESTQAGFSKPAAS